jgi:hypothetical protein
MRFAPLLALGVSFLSACSSAPIGGPLPGTGIPPGPYTPGQSYFGHDNYIEYIAGNSPVIFTAPHGGALLPATIPDRTDASCGASVSTTTDLNTTDLARAMQQRWFARFGRYPHIVINHLARRKLDPNRPGAEAACGNADATAAYQEWHLFIDAAKTTALAASGKAWYMDMHGHGHATQRLELGYLLTGAQLDLNDAALDANVALQDTSSIRVISETSPLSFSALLRGSTSLGALYAAAGFPSVPANIDASPRADPYFSGGDNTRRHTCGAEATAFGGTTRGMVCGVQIEANLTGVRDNAANRDRFGDATALVLEQYLALHWNLRVQ